MKKQIIAVIMLVLSGPLFSPPLLAAGNSDLNGDRIVDIYDYNILVTDFGRKGAPGFIPADIDRNGQVDIYDFNEIVTNYGVTYVSGTPTATQPPIPGGTKITFSPSFDDIPNPERGFMHQANVQVDQPYSSKLMKRNSTDTVDWVYFHLEKYRDPRDGKGIAVSNYQYIPLEPVGSGKGLDTVKKTFDDARSRGMKLIIRFLYVGYSGIGSTSDFVNAEPDVPLDVALKHIEQLGPVISQNKDVIVAIQTGIVGYFGEWHSSKYLGALDARKAIIDKWLAVLPSDRTIQVRYPKYVQRLYGGPVSQSIAYNQSALARIGFYDDAAFKDDTDDGTFTSNAMGQTISSYCTSTQCWREYFGKQSLYTSVSGEAGTHSGTASAQADCPNALIQLNNLHFSSLHNGYSMVTLNHWVSGGCMPEIRRRLGYRFELKEVTVPTSVKPGGTYTVLITVRNSGFANMINPRPVYLVLMGANRHEVILAGIDPRRWGAGSETTATQSFTLPSNIPDGTYRLGLWLPDSATNLRANPAYSVRFANAALWDAQTGMNILTSNFRVSQ